MPLSLRDGEELRLHAYMDGSVVGVIGCDHAPVQVIVMPDLAADPALVVVQGNASVEAWPLVPTLIF